MRLPARFVDASSDPLVLDSPGKDVPQVEHALSEPRTRRWTTEQAPHSLSRLVQSVPTSRFEPVIPEALNASGDIALRKFCFPSASEAYPARLFQTPIPDGQGPSSGVAGVGFSEGETMSGRLTPEGKRSVADEPSLLEA